MTTLSKMLKTLARFVGFQRRVTSPLWEGDEAAPTWFEIAPGYIGIQDTGAGPLQPGFTPAHKIREEQKAV